MESGPEQSLYAFPIAQHLKKLSQLRKTLQDSDLPQSGRQDTEAELQLISQCVYRATGPNYYAFVTGGVTPIAARADHLVTDIDANVGVHLPDVSIATDLEDTTLRWLLQMFDLDPQQWKHRILTTGATASNLLGLACGRDYVVQEAARRKGLQNVSVAQLGLLGALNAVDSKGIRIITTISHSSLSKAASIVGLGRDALIDVTRPTTVLDFDIDSLRKELERDDYLNIVAVSCSEVNTGIFATTGETMQSISDLCKKHGAWLHIDGGRSRILLADLRMNKLSPLQSRLLHNYRELFFN
jgi:glutamate/tyrosine decarboxylase-like PLP-dependent enzyme